MKKFKIWIMLFACVIAIMLTAMPPQVANAAPTSDKIKDMEKQISNAEKDMKELKNSLSDVKKLVKQLENEKSDLKNYVVQLDNTLAAIEEKITNLLMQITRKEADIIEAQEQLVHAKEVEANQYESMGERIKYSYEKGTYHYLQLLFTASSFSDLLNKLTYEEEMARYEKDKLDEYIEAREYVELCEQQLQVEKQYLDAMKVSVENEQTAVETLIEAKKQEIEKYENSISSQEKAIKEYEADIAEQNEIIKQLEKAVEEEKKKLLANSAIKYDGGTFAFPLESYTRISDNYGWRIHPTLHVKQFHNGVDFAAPKGTPIYAAYDGDVVAATYSSTMGNYIMIDHGSGLYTIYMHASKLYVSKGDKVIKGEKIAGVGTTGRSTGNHLHFSVRLNGDYVSPWNYLSK